jgi:hypothetical protein
MAKLYAVSRGRERAVISGLHQYALEVPDLAVAEGFLQDCWVAGDWEVPPHLWGTPPPAAFLNNLEPRD